MEDHTEDRDKAMNDDRNVNGEAKIKDEQIEPGLEITTASEKCVEMEPKTVERNDDSCVSYSYKENDTIPTSCAGETRNEGNLLGSVVTMHNVTNCNDDYSQTLASCDIFNKSKASPASNESKQCKDGENKEEFLIIDLDTCQMERASKRTRENESTEKGIRSPSNDLVLVNLSSEEVTPDIPSNANNSDDDGGKKNENNFLLDTKGSDIHHCDNLKENEESHKEITLPLQSLEKENITTEVIENTYTRQIKRSHIDANVKRENCLQNKEILFQDVQLTDDSIMSREMFSSEVSFHSNDLNATFRSQENQEESEFYMPELYSRNYEDEKKTSYDSSLETDNSNHFYDYAIHDNTPYDESPLSTNPFNDPNSNVVYTQQQVENIQQYNFQSKIISNFVEMEKKNDSSFAYHNPNTRLHRFKNRPNATSGSIKISQYSTAQEHTSTTPFFHSPCISSYRAPYPHNNMQQATDTNTQPLPSSASTYSDWGSWNNYPFYEVNLNNFPSVHSSESQYPQGKDDWCNGTAMTELYNDPEMSIKSSQAEIDSEATEDADETDDVPIFFDESTDFSACDNLSTMSVMSNSCYSDTSSVMTPMSPSDFTPPPSISNTPPPNLEKNLSEDQCCNYPFLNENSRSEPLHLYSPTMLSVTPYKLSKEKIEPNLLTFGRGQGIKRYYPSMADMHNSRSGFSIPSTSSKFETDGLFEFSDCRKSSKNQIQSDKISTSTTRSTYIKKTVNTGNYTTNPSLEFYADYMKQENEDFQNDSRRVRHNEPLKQVAIRIMSQWYEEHLDNPYPTKEDKIKMARDGGITVTQVKSWFANKRNRTNNTKPKVQKRAMKEKLKKLFQDLKHSRSDSLDNSHIIQQLSGIIQT